jgi:hypothetical protein
MKFSHSLPAYPSPKDLIALFYMHMAAVSIYPCIFFTAEPAKKFARFAKGFLIFYAKTFFNERIFCVIGE